MTHTMKLKTAPFNAIKKGTKAIEMRLYDEKRKAIEIGDVIKFTRYENSDEFLFVRVLNLHIFKNFEELYSKFDKTKLGYKEDEDAKWQDMESYYSQSQQNEYGVVGIEISLLK